MPDLPVCLQVFIVQKGAGADIVLRPFKLFVRTHAAEVVLADVPVRELSPHSAGHRSVISANFLCR